MNKNSIINILLLALNWNEFANDLKPRVMPTGEPIKFRPEYMTPVEEQTLGTDGLPSGVDRAVPRMIAIGELNGDRPEGPAAGA